MKRAILFLILAVVCSFAAAEEVNDFFPLPFMQMLPEATPQDNFELEQRLWDVRFKLMEVEKTIESLKQDKTNLENLQRSVELRGSAAVKVSTFTITGSGAAKAIDFLGRPLWYDAVEGESQTRGSKANETHKLYFIGRPAPNIAIKAGVKGSVAWAGSSRFSIDELSISTGTSNLQTIAGVYWAGFTPLTLFYPSYPSWFESELFADLKTSYLEDQGIEGNNRRLSGIWGRYEIDNLAIQGLGAKLRSRDGTNPGLRHRFLTGLQIRLLPQNNMSVGINWLEAKDDLASGSGAAIDNEVLGVTLQARNFWQNLSFNGEFAGSIYNPDLTKRSPVAKDSAWYADLIWQDEQFSTMFRVMRVGPLYRSIASQSRDYTIADFGVFGPGNAQTLMGGINEQAANEALAYGLATPNRQGVQLQIAYRPAARFRIAGDCLFLKEGTPALADGTLTDAFTALRAYQVARAGGDIDLTNLINIGSRKYPQRPFHLLGQIELRRTTRSESTDSAADTKLLLQDAIVDLAVSYELRPGWKLLAGNKLFQRSGEVGSLSSRNKHNTFIIGVKVEVTPEVSVSLTQQLTSFADEMSAANNYDGKASTLAVKARF